MLAKEIESPADETHPTEEELSCRRNCFAVSYIIVVSRNKITHDNGSLLLWAISG
jgi:hypothetical protein